VLVRYIGWTVLHYGLYLAFGARLDPWTTLRYAITGGDRGVWFLVLLVQLYVLTPLLVPWVKAHPRRAAAFAVVLQILHSGIYYLRAAGLDTWVHREFVFLQLPFFILGILATGRGDRIVAALAGRRRLLAAATVAAFALLLLEQALLHRLFPSMHFFPETLTVALAGGLTILWGFAAESAPNRAREALNYVGMRSLGILLVHGYALRGCVSFLWHFERILGLTTRPRTEAPLWMFAHAWTIVPLFAASLGVSLLLIEAVERVAGKRVRTLLFG
jgi:surface polysaccharide O-acyltransferase-like enzyme